MKEIAVDCILNAKDNGNIPCFSFGENIEGLASFPRLSRDLGMGVGAETRKIERQLRVGAISMDGMVYFMENKKIYSVVDIARRKPIERKGLRLKKRVALDLDKREIYDLDVAETSKTGVRIGYFNEMGQFYKE